MQILLRHITPQFVRFAEICEGFIVLTLMDSHISSMKEFICSCRFWANFHERLREEMWNDSQIESWISLSKSSFKTGCSFSYFLHSMHML